MRISVYSIYLFACLIAIGAAILSGLVIADTFAAQQVQTEKAQYNTGLGQIGAMQTIVKGQMLRMQTVSDANLRRIQFTTSLLPDSAFLPENIVGALNDTLYNAWVPDVRAPNQLNGFGVAFMYPSLLNVTFTVSIQAFSDVQKTGKREYAYAYTMPEDGLCHAFRTVWGEDGTPSLMEEMYPFEVYSSLQDIYFLDDYFTQPFPSTASDGNSYWYFTHIRATQVRGLWVNIQTYDSGVEWYRRMMAVRNEGAEFLVLNHADMVMVATAAAEDARLQNCTNVLDHGELIDRCLTSPAASHPTQELRDVRNALYNPSWSDRNAPEIAPTQYKFTLNGKPHMAIVSALFAQNDFRTIVIWYQPWAVVQGNVVGLSALICTMTVLSTIVLTLLGTFGILLPLMQLGASMRTVASSLSARDKASEEAGEEEEATIESRPPSVFTEVQSIQQDFETIVVEFLGFSKTNARDNKFAPKDGSKPFAVLFTDIQSSTGLWGKDPAEMSRCVQTHHELIRKLIKKHRLYEVKTVGDSFMATTTSAQDAVLFAIEIQTEFFRFEWHWDAADEFYQETTKVFLDASAAAYKSIWNGLRVRIGIHYGSGDVTYDEVSKGYDYYGTVVNTAARIESVAHGGQVVVSEDVIAALGAPLDQSIASTKRLGRFPLRGVAVPPALVEVVPTPLQNRVYPPLRVEEDDHAAPTPKAEAMPKQQPDMRRHSSAHSLASHGGGFDLDPDDLAATHSLVKQGMSAAHVSQYLSSVCQTLEDLCRPLAAQQLAVYKALAKGWGVAPPRSRAEFNACALRVAQRLSETTKVHQLLQKRESSTLSPSIRKASKILSPKHSAGHLVESFDVDDDTEINSEDQ